MKLGRDVSRHDELDNWRNTHRYETVMAIIWLFWTISETDPGLWDRLLEGLYTKAVIPKSWLLDRRLPIVSKPLTPTTHSH